VVNIILPMNNCIILGLHKLKTNVDPQKWSSHFSTKMKIRVSIIHYSLYFFGLLDYCISIIPY
jgi:hypothetical protein